MAIRSISVILVLVAGVSACTRPDRFGDDGTDPNGGFAGGPAVSAEGSPDPASDPASPAYFRQTVGDRVLFAVDSSSLTEEGRATLTGQARWLMENPEYLAVIEGHADERGTREYNLALGARRANAAREFLISQGVPATRMRTVSYGKERPIEICSEEVCFSQNRRAVTIISAGAVS